MPFWWSLICTLPSSFDGLRHDSGDPVVWGEKALTHYAKLKIDAHTKRLVFSDGLDVPTAIRLHQHFADRVQTGFGIGTNLSNDTGLRPLNIVMKLVSCNGNRPPSCLTRQVKRCVMTRPSWPIYARSFRNQNRVFSMNASDVTGLLAMTFQLGAVQVSLGDVLGFITGLLCVWLTAKANIWNFPMGIL